MAYFKYRISPNLDAGTSTNATLAICTNNPDTGDIHICLYLPFYEKAAHPYIQQSTTSQSYFHVFNLTFSCALVLYTKGDKDLSKQTATHQVYDPVFGS